MYVCVGVGDPMLLKGDGPCSHSYLGCAQSGLNLMRVKSSYLEPSSPLFQGFTGTGDIWGEFAEGKIHEI